MIFLVLFGGLAAIFLGQYFPLHVQLKKSIKISQDVMSGVLKSPQSVFQKREKGYYINLITSSSFSYGDVYGQVYIDLIANSIYAMIIIIIAGLINIYFSVLFILYIPLCWLTIKEPSKRIAKFQKEGLLTQDKFLSETKRIIETKREINIAHADHFFEKRYNDRSFEYLKFIQKYRLFEIISRNLPMILAKFYQIVILSFSAYLTYKSEVSIGSIFLLYQFINHFNIPIARVFEILIYEKINQPHIERVETALKEAEMDSGFDEMYIDHYKSALSMKDFQLYIDKDKNKRLFSVENMNIPNHSFVVVKGDNGCGKSMFFNYLTSFSDVNNAKGEIAVNSDFKYASYLTYPPIIIGGDIEDNMFGNKINKEVKSMLGIDFDSKRIRDNPINLSFGQQQKLNLLRVLSSNKQTVILDEPFTNLDKDTQKNLIQYIKSLKGKKTIFLIMHSSEFDKYADCILHISDKRLYK